MSRSIYDDINIKGYSGIRHLRAWIQKVLPQVYDDALSYQELIYKLLHWINTLIDDVEACEDNIQALLDAIENHDFDNKVTVGYDNTPNSYNMTFETVDSIIPHIDPSSRPPAMQMVSGILEFPVRVYTETEGFEFDETLTTYIPFTIPLDTEETWFVGHSHFSANSGLPVSVISAVKGCYRLENDKPVFNTSECIITAVGDGVHLGDTYITPYFKRLYDQNTGELISDRDIGSVLNEHFWDLLSKADIREVYDWTCGEVERLDKRISDIDDKYNLRVDEHFAIGNYSGDSVSLTLPDGFIKDDASEMLSCTFSVPVNIKTDAAKVDLYSVQAFNCDVEVPMNATLALDGTLTSVTGGVDYFDGTNLITVTAKADCVYNLVSGVPTVTITPVDAIAIGEFVNYSLTTIRISAPVKISSGSVWDCISWAYIHNVEKYFEEKINTVESELNDKIDSVESELNNKIDSVESELNDKIDSVESELNDKIDSVDSELNDKIDSVESELNDKIDIVESDFNNKIDALDERVTTLEDCCGEVQDKFNDYYTKEEIDELISQLNKSLYYLLYGIETSSENLLEILLNWNPADDNDPIYALSSAESAEILEISINETRSGNSTYRLEANENDSILEMYIARAS